MKKVSIIIPNYNNEKYIGECIDSVLNQDYPKKEIIVVDSSSTDNSIQIIQKYTKKNNCVKFYTINNVGPNRARKLGIEKSSGEYIMFVDSDDFLKAGAIKMLVEKIENYNVDVVRFESERCSNKDRVAPILEDNKTEEFVYHDDIVRLLTTGFKLTSVWSKLYRRTLFDNLKAFDLDISFGEDLLISADILGKLDKILIIPDVSYCYRDDSESLTRTVDRKQIIKNIRDRIFVSHEMLEFIKNNASNEEIKQHAIYEQLRVIWETIKRLSLIEYEKEDFYIDFIECLSGFRLADDDFEKLCRYVHKMKFLDRLKNRDAVIAIAKNDIDGVWANFSKYKTLRKILRRGK